MIGPLLRAVDPVAGVAEPGHDVGVLVQPLVQRGQGDDGVGIAVVDRGDALGASDDRQQVDIVGPGPGQHVESVDGATAGGQHRVDQQHLPLADPFRQLLVVLDRAVGLRVAVEAEVADPAVGDQGQDGLHHHQPGPENADDGRGRAIQHRRLGGGDRRGDRDRFRRQVTQRLVGGQQRDLLAQRSERRRLGGFVAQHGDLVGHQRVVDHVQRPVHR